MLAYVERRRRTVEELRDFGSGVCVLRANGCCMKSCECLSARMYKSRHSARVNQSAYGNPAVRVSQFSDIIVITIVA